MTKSIHRQQNVSYAQAVGGRAAKEDIETVKTNVFINFQQLVKVITTGIRIDREEFDFIDQWLTKQRKQCEKWWKTLFQHFLGAGHMKTGTG